MSEIKYFTQEGLQKLKEELDDLILRERPRIVQAIQEARDKGDLSENAEYDAAKEAQGLLEAKIAELQDLIFNARILDESKMDTSKVLLYSTVKIPCQLHLAVRQHDRCFHHYGCCSDRCRCA